MTAFPQTREVLQPTDEVTVSGGHDVIYPDTGTTTSDAIRSRALAELDAADQRIAEAEAAFNIGHRALMLMQERAEAAEQRIEKLEAALRSRSEDACECGFYMVARDLLRDLDSTEDDKPWPCDRCDNPIRCLKDFRRGCRLDALEACRHPNVRLEYRDPNHHLRVDVMPREAYGQWNVCEDCGKQWPGGQDESV